MSVAPPVAARLDTPLLRMPPCNRTVVVDLDIPSRETLAQANDVTPADLPAFAPARRTADQPRVADVPAAVREALRNVDFSDLPEGAEVAVTAGSRGISDVATVTRTVVSWLRERGFEPFVLPAMGSHGGGTAEGQREMLASLGITPESVGCEFRPAMDVEPVGRGRDDRPIHCSTVALDADGVVLVNRIKPHTDFNGPYESGLCKMAVIGLGKHTGADATHDAALRHGFADVIPERAAVVFEHAPIVGGVGLVENAAHELAHVEGVDAAEVFDREPALLERAYDRLPTLPVDELDLLVVDEMGKDVSGTGLDTNVVGRIAFHGVAEPETPNVTRVYVRSLTPASHGNGLGVGLADFVHEDVLADLDLTDTYLNVASSGEPARAKLPYAVPADSSALTLACSTTGVADPAEMDIARIDSTLDPWHLSVSEPLARRLADRDEWEVGERRSLAFDDDGNFRE